MVQLAEEIDHVPSFLDKIPAGVLRTITDELMGIAHFSANGQVSQRHIDAIKALLQGAGLADQFEIIAEEGNAQLVPHFSGSKLI